ncbi:MAG: lipoprotein signal peptidase [Gammaproteobacteria bacterium]|nr:MAG: lipoprotein signal peptidase [Gammaproteobacteria bacterium]
MRLPGMLHYAWVGALVLVLDQITKAWVRGSMMLGERTDLLPFLAWLHVENPGAAFSFLADAGGWQRWFFVVLAVVFSAWLLWELSRLPRGEQRLLATAHGLVLGGALGNLVDRIATGRVTDFVLVHWGGAYFPAFNVADAAITVGAAFWILLAVLEWRRHRQVQDKSI